MYARDIVLLSNIEVFPNLFWNYVQVHNVTSKSYDSYSSCFSFWWGEGAFRFTTCIYLFFFLKTLLRGANKIDPKAHETSVYRLIIRCTDVEFEIFHIFIYFLFRVSVFACADYILKNARHFKSRNNCNGIDWILNLNLPNNTAQTFFVCNYSSLPRSRRTKRSILSRFPTYSRAVSYIFFFLFSFFSARSTDMRLRFFVLTRVNILIDKWDNNNTVNVSRLN